MPNDLVTLKALAYEMKDILTDGRIDKIGMPSDDEVVLVVRSRGENHALYLSARADTPRVHFTKVRFQNAPTPPNFCMLLRKHILFGVVEDVKILNEDRLFEFTIVARNELNDATTFRLIIEIMGGASNIILLREDYKIIDAVKRVMNLESRVVFPGASYTYPPKSKASITDLEAVSAACASGEVKKVYGTLNGLSKESALELMARVNQMGVSAASNLVDDSYHSDLFEPVSQWDNKGKCVGFFAYPYLSRMDKGEYKKESTLSGAIDAFYKASGEALKKQRDTLKLNQKLKAITNKTERRIKDNEQTLLDTEKKERYRELGEILKCNIYRINKGMSIINCDDFYNTGLVEITLDPLISPQKNVEKYFKRYNKAKGAEAYAREELKRLLELQEYLKTIKVAVQNCSTEAEYQEINSELDSLKKLPVQVQKDSHKKNPKKPKKTPPLSLEIAGFKVYVGKNNLQNDEVTFGLASSNDTWLHTKTYHGSHGVILSKGKPVPPTVLERVAEIVAYYSEGREDTKVEVDYTERKNVKKLGKIGLVTYTNYKTIIVAPKKEA
ncbi:MAG: NFACT family protein [Clostridia bacterium]|nr:NFACT family protein [Clostridia bacterium]